jgi:Lrp/AsnC family transcriptional regulator, leucine-responsive regulatory protein
MNLDKKDWRILYELDFEARQTNKQIGKKVGLSAEAVRYRIQQLEKQNIIQRYMMIVRFTRVGMKQHKMYLKFHNLTKKAKEDILNYCLNNKKIIWVASCLGSYDLLIATLTKTVDDFLEVKSNVLKELKDYIVDYRVTHMAESITYRRNYFIDKKEHLPQEALLDKADDESVQLDKVDMDILRQLGEDGRMSAIDIAKKVYSSQRIVSYRIKAMETQGIIHGCKLSLNYQKLGILFFKTFIKLKDCSEKRIHQFVGYCRTNPHIIHHVRTIGDWDVEPEFEVTSIEQFQKLLAEMREKFADIIQTIDTQLITDEHKFTYFFA